MPFNRYGILWLPLLGNVTTQDAFSSKRIQSIYWQGLDGSDFVLKDEDDVVIFTGATAAAGSHIFDGSVVIGPRGVKVTSTGNSTGNLYIYFSNR